MVPSGLPGIRGLASEVLSELYEGSLVAVSIPRGSNGERWLTWLLEALRDQARQRGEPLPVKAPSLSGSLTDPFSELAATEGIGGIESLAHLLEYFPDEGALVLVIECERILSPEWKEFFGAVRRAYLGAGSCRLRPVLAIIVGSREYPPITHDVASRVFGLWNIVRWEELRLLAGAALPQEENALTRAWRVATYAGAANGDPDMLLRLCRESPNRLVQVFELASDGMDEQIGPEWNAGTVPERRWQVPAVCVEPWASGQLLGQTVERGAVRVVGGMSREVADRYLHAAIWREQLTGLFPVIVELGFSATSAITSVLGLNWQRGISPDRRISDGDLRLEPKEILEILDTGRFGRVPKSIRSFLDLLRRTRNDLAHMSPIELQRMRQIWQEHDLISRRFGNSQPLHSRT